MILYLVLVILMILHIALCDEENNNVKESRSLRGGVAATAVTVPVVVDNTPVKPIIKKAKEISAAATAITPKLKTIPKQDVALPPTLPKKIIKRKPKPKLALTSENHVLPKKMKRKPKLPSASDNENTNEGWKHLNKWNHFQSYSKSNLKPAPYGSGKKKRFPTDEYLSPMQRKYMKYRSTDKKQMYEQDIPLKAMSTSSEP